MQKDLYDAGMSGHAASMAFRASCSARRQDSKSRPDCALEPIIAAIARSDLLQRDCRSMFGIFLMPAASTTGTAAKAMAAMAAQINRFDFMMLPHDPSPWPRYLSVDRIFSTLAFCSGVTEATAATAF